ncbi:hypothetical protein dsx2_0152 [Desulfovibrio sp. X2]|uniref:hypothetical protein n=1 Tax=Desulfovibrio sp. X2 TaxID=941449 RepID=UPI000358DBA2|nr:hypothetical protein [Desulfovibrio sp. X2]EPR42225.1 hypothetical protein dsx2_0152 [Desulfovibrio sp. X2]
MTRKHLLVFVLVAFALLGCTKVKKTYKWVKNGIDPNPQIELKPGEFSDASQELLAKLFLPVDAKLQELIRVVESQDAYPEKAWFQIVFTRYPWVSGVIVVESTGEIIDQQPGYSLKPIDLKPLLDVGEAWNDGRMRSLVQPTDLGPEIYLANAYTKNRSWIGLTVVHFDFRNLMQFCPAPDKLIVLSPKAILWPGGDEDTAKQLLDFPWAKMLASDVEGQVELKDARATYTWLARYVGDEPIVYLVRDVPQS